MKEDGFGFFRLNFKELLLIHFSKSEIQLDNSIRTVYKKWVSQCS